jgi:hypothetical protein
MEKKCFVVTPIGGQDSEIRRAADGVIDTVIKPVLEDFGFQVDVAHKMYNSGSINKQILNRIINDDLVVVNLTNLNPNVMYELGVRHAVRKPVVQICEHNTKLPFDITEERTIFFKNDMAGVIDLRDTFIKTVEMAINEEVPDNPIFRAIESDVILLSNINRNLTLGRNKEKKIIRKKTLDDAYYYLFYINLKKRNFNLMGFLKQIFKEKDFLCNVEYWVIEETDVLDVNYKIWLKNQDKINIDEIGDLIETSSGTNIEVKYIRTVNEY